PRSTVFPYTTLFRSECIRQRGGAGGVEADDVALHEVAVRAAAVDPDAIGGVAGDQVPRARGRAADEVAGGAPFDVHAGVAADSEDRKSTRLNSSHVE